MDERLTGERPPAPWEAARSLELEQAEPAAALEFVWRALGPQVVLASSFGAEDMVLLDAVARAGIGVEVCYVDTGLLFPETHALIGRAAARYLRPLRRLVPQLGLEEQAERHGPALWERDPDLCCRLRKVEPLAAHLRGKTAWITGIRREQSPTRRRASFLEWDAGFGLWKVNPLVGWDRARVWAYLEREEVPVNPLHRRGYPSIGCVPCTAPVPPGAPERSGRWPGRAKTECGLHGRPGFGR